MNVRPNKETARGWSFRQEQGCAAKFERSLRRVISEYIELYNGERFHQGMGNQRLAEPEACMNDDGEVSCRERLGGLLRYYYR